MQDEFLYGTVKEIARRLGGDFGLSSEKQTNSSEFRNLSFEVSFHSSEVSFPASVGDFRLLAGYFRFPRESPQIVLGFCKF